VWTGGPVISPLLPFGLGFGGQSVSATFVPAAGEYDVQMGLLDFTDPDGISMSQRAHLSVLPSTPIGALALGDDANVQISAALPAAMCITPWVDVTFYGTVYDHCYVSSNGFVSFTAGSSDFSATYGEWTLLMPRVGVNADFRPDLAGTITYNQLADGFRVDYSGVTEWPSTTAGVTSYSVEVSTSLGAGITGFTTDGTWGGTATVMGVTNGAAGTHPGAVSFDTLFGGGGLGAGLASDSWIDANAGGMIIGAGGLWSNVVAPAADGSSIVIN
jgi:hypothetical protein